MNERFLSEEEGSNNVILIEAHTTASPFAMREIADALLARKLPFAPSRKAALALLKVPGWTEGLEQMLPIRGRLECAHVLELCSCVLPRLAPRPEEGWLAFCTQYARERMYPGQGFAPDREEYEAGALFFLTVLQVMLDRERCPSTP